MDSCGQRRLVPTLDSCANPNPPGREAEREPASHARTHHLTALRGMVPSKANSGDDVRHAWVSKTEINTSVAPSSTRPGRYRHRPATEPTLLCHRLGQPPRLISLTNQMDAPASLPTPGRWEPETHATKNLVCGRVLEYKPGDPGNHDGNLGPETCSGWSRPYSTRYNRLAFHSLGSAMVHRLGRRARRRWTRLYRRNRWSTTAYGRCQASY